MQPDVVAIRLELPSPMMLASATLPVVSQSSEALNSIRWFFSHIALWEEQARSMKSLSLER